MDLIFIESRDFTEKIRALVDDEAYRIFQYELQDDPERGALIRGTGGVRKVRMRLPGQGKSGGARVIYLYLKSHAIIYLLTVYNKKEQTDLSAEQTKAIRRVVGEIKRAYRDRV